MTGRQSSEKSVFLTAMEIDSAAEREAYLQEVCRGNEKLYADVRILLEAHGRSSSLLDAPLIGTNPTSPELQVHEGPGIIIGRYKLLQQIGEGGFGLVYMAEQQEPVVRKVALKIIKVGMDTRQVVARFEAERQALAMMDHPNIAKMHDAGATDSGRPYFVMELVRGVPITQYSDSNKLDMGQRLGLFIDICNAVQHAHQKGIIHRDIKPNNVMVTMRGGQPVPKVIDFGIAKATQQRLTEKTLFTKYHQFIGTPQYMSPEQALMSDGDVDTRTDIYSLGVLLYELLVGRTPFDATRLHEVGLEDICRIIREEEPPRPSRCLSTLGEATVTTISSARQTQPTLLQRQVRGDLDWIVMKAIDKDRNRRYSTANDFAADIERYLNNDPVDARPPSTTYLFRKFARRNSALLTTLSLVAASILVGTAFSIWFGARESFTRRELEVERQKLLQQQEQTEAARNKAEDLRYVSDMNRAMQALSDSDLRLVRHLLREHHPSSRSSDGTDRRRWEWYYLWRACRDAVPTLRHQHIVNTFAISPDGSTLVSGDGAGKLNVWDVASHRLLDSIKAHRSWVWNVEFSPGGTMLASTGAEAPVRLWKIDPSTSTFVDDGVLESERPGANWCVTLSDDGRFLAAGGKGGRLWDLSTRRQIAEFNGGFFALAFRPDGHALAAHCNEQVVVWQLPYDSNKKPLVIPGFQNITWVDIAFSPDGQLLAASWKTNGVKLFNAADGEPVSWLQTGIDAYSFAFAPDGKTIAVGNADKTVSIWDAETGEKLKEFLGHSSDICCLRYAPDGTLVSSSIDQTVRLWQPDLSETEVEQPEYPQGYTGPLRALSLSPDGRWAAAANGIDGYSKSGVVLWDTRTWRVAREFTADGTALDGSAFSHDSRLLAVAENKEKCVQLWDLHASRFVGQIPGSGPLAFSPDGYLALWGKQTLELWDPRNAKQPAIVRSTSGSSFSMNAVTMEFSPDGQTLAVADWRGDIALLDPKTLEIVHHAKEAVELWGHHLAFSPDGRFLVAPDYDHTVKVWDVRDGTLNLRKTLGGHTDSAMTAAFSPDGLLAVGCANGQVKLWDSATWRERVAFKCVDRSVNGIGFTPMEGL